MHFLKLTDFTKEQLLEIFKIADDLAVKPRPQALAGKTAVLFFPESSIRTRVTFEKAIYGLGGQSILFPSTTLDKKEALKDVVSYLENWADLLIVRHGQLDKMKAMASHAKIPVINAMSSVNHPCEVMSDLYALRRIRPDYADLAYTFVGENGNIGRAWAEIAQVMQLRFNHVSVSGQAIKENGPFYHFSSVLVDTLVNTDIVLTDGLPPEMKNQDYYDHYQITLERMKTAKPGALLNPCPPFTCGEEVSTEVIDSDYFVGYGFKSDLLLVQQAIVLFCMGEGDMGTGGLYDCKD